VIYTWKKDLHLKCHAKFVLFSGRCIMAEKLTNLMLAQNAKIKNHAQII
jgi:hypothetical protein